MSELKDEEQGQVLPNSGFASNLDKLRAHSPDYLNKQALWKQKSEEVIREFIEKIATFPSFLAAFTFLANKRHQLAIELQQKTDEGRTDYYGTFRKEGDHARRSISSGDGEQYWRWQKNKIFELTYELIASFADKLENTPQIAVTYEDEYVICIKEKVSVDDKIATYYTIAIKFPFKRLYSESDKHPDMLSQIELYMFEENKKFNLIRIEYAVIDNRYMPMLYQTADHYYQALLNWNRDAGVEEFYHNAAKLTYLVAHIMLVKQGNAAITEWMLRALAFKNGLQLGHYNLSERISWDFKALLTPNLETYCKWFSEKLFSGYTLLQSGAFPQNFTFPHHD